MVRTLSATTRHHRRALVVDPDAGTRRPLCDLLERHDIAVITATDGASAQAALASTAVDVVLLDRATGDDAGLALCAAIRRSSRVAILMLGAGVTPGDRISGLESGADDYVCRPIDPRELMARLRSVLRRTACPPAAATSRPADGRGWRLDPLSRIATAPDGRSAALPSAECRLLSVFLRHPNRVLSRDALMGATRGGPVSPDDRSIDLLVSRLRRRLPGGEAAIRTLRGAGYRFDPHGQPSDRLAVHHSEADTNGTNAVHIRALT